MLQGILQWDIMVSKKTMHLQPGLIAKQATHLFFSQPPFAIAFQGNLFEDMARHVIPRHRCRHILRQMYGNFHSHAPSLSPFTIAGKRCHGNKASWPFQDWAECLTARPDGALLWPSRVRLREGCLR